MRPALAQRLAAGRTVVRGPLVIAAIALVARLLEIAITRHSFLLANDAADYWRLARLIATGHGFGTSHFAPGGGPTAERPPGFPFLLAAIVFLAGPHAVAARIAGALLGALAAALVYVLARQITAEPRLAAVAGVVAAVFPPMVIASTSLMSEALFVPVSLGVIVSALAYRRGGSVLWLPLAGFLLGVATVTRPVGALLAIPALLIVLARRELEHRAGGLFAAGVLALAPCLAWEVRDISELHSVVPLTTQSGYLLAGTYNSTSARDRQQPGVWMVATRDPAMARVFAAHPHAGEVQLSDDLQHAALRYVGRHPSYVLTVVGHNLLRLFDLTTLRFDQGVVRGEYGYGSSAGTAEYVSSIIVLALSALGMAGATLGRWPRWPVAVTLVPVLLILVTVPVQSFSRFRAPIDPYLVVLASAPLAAALGTLARRLRATAAAVARPA